MKHRLAIRCLLILAAMIGAQAQAGDCIKDQHGKVLCAKEGGGAIRDRYGVVRCGVGFCASDDEGRVKCSARAGGGAAVDSNGTVNCLDGCQDATPELCASTP